MASFLSVPAIWSLIFIFLFLTLYFFRVIIEELVKWFLYKKAYGNWSICLNFVHDSQHSFGIVTSFCLLSSRKCQFTSKHLLVGIPIHKRCRSILTPEIRRIWTLSHHSWRSTSFHITWQVSTALWTTLLHCWAIPLCLRHAASVLHSKTSHLTEHVSRKASITSKFIMAWQYILDW